MQTLAFLSPTQIRQNATDAGLEPAVIEPLLALAARVVGDPALYRCSQQLYAKAYQQAAEAIEPSPETLFGDAIHLLYLLIALDAIGRIRSLHQQRGIPEAITRESYVALPMSIRRFADGHSGKIGLEDWVAIYWFGKVVATGDLYRLGRMEFILQPFEGNLRLYRHKESGQLQALAEAGIRFRADGYLPFTPDEPAIRHYGWGAEEPLPDDWVTTLVEDEAFVTGTPIHRQGYARKTTLQLAKPEWELLLRNGDSVLDMHIPNYMPLQIDRLRDSFQRALDFFPRYHPERPFKAFACSSWLFNTQWTAWLPAESNILAFQRQGYLFPLESDGAEGLYFIFGSWLVDLDHAEQDTQLQRAVVKHLRTGGKLRNGGFLLLPEEVARFGSV